MIEAEGGVRVIIKRELFFGIQQGRRIDPKTGRLIKADDTKNVTDNVTDDNLRELTERQRVIIRMLHFDDIEDVTETTSTLAQKTGVSRRTIARDMDVLRVPRPFIQLVLYVEDSFVHGSLEFKEVKSDFRMKFGNPGANLRFAA